ncbi:hypothetical protein CI109_105741 [Kwoniella shandongensis]|uniref:General transcription factor TFIIB n=1 Tax=Kwoniella shandongensis TaxID=1734106 RepID=A0AAJ8LNT1_9TREE
MLLAAGPKPPGPKFGQPVAPNLNVRQICPNCRIDPPNIIEEYSKGDLVCGDCGTILGDRIVDTRSEYGRTGIARDLNRAMNRANGLSNGINAKTNTATLSAVFSRIGEKCDSMLLPRNVRERAQHVYKIVDEKRAIRGKNDAVVDAACIVYACRDAGAHRTFGEVCKALKVPKKELGQVFNVVKMTVQTAGGNRSGMESVHGSNNAQDSAEALLGRFSNYLDLGNAVFNVSKHIAGEAVARSGMIDGRSPVSIAAGVLYFTCLLMSRQTTAKDIAAMGGVSESTTKLICKMVANKLDEVIRPEWKTEFKEGYAALASLGKSSDASTKNSRAGTPSRTANGESKPSASAANGETKPAVNGDGETKANGDNTAKPTTNGGDAKA